MYVCGITPYDATHLGHANTYVAFDLLNRAWRDAGLDVTYVQNVTDVDDPLLERATETGVEWADLARDQIELFRTDMAALNVIPPDHLIGAVESIDLVTGLIERLRGVDGAIYPVEDVEHPDLYFARASDGRFGSLSRLGAEAVEIFAERGGDPDRAGKKDPLDCLVWRLERAGEPSWGSPFGPGRPGWHIECTAIALNYLGPEFDVQGGGSDLIFPHHEMCAAEGRVATGQEFAKAYVHSGMVGLDGEKMSKSKGNLESGLPAPGPGRRPDGDPAGPALPALPRGLVLDRRPAHRGHRATGAVARGRAPRRRHRLGRDPGRGPRRAPQRPRRPRRGGRDRRLGRRDA